jgi:hypothetical protein
MTAPTLLDIVRDEARIFPLIALGSIYEAAEACAIEPTDDEMAEAIAEADRQGLIVVSKHVNAWDSLICELGAR